jgi:hypothetical protein
MKFKILNLLAIIALVFSLACSDDESSEVNTSILGYQYQPLSIGQELIYQVDSIAYDDFTGTVDTLSYKLKEVTEEVLLSLEGNKEYLISIYKRSSDTINWTKQRVIKKSIVGTRFEKLDNNLLTIPLVFPISEEVSWDVNSLNTEDVIFYSYESFHKTGMYNNIEYDSVLLVNQLDEENLIEKLFSQEVYAAGVGMIEKQDIAINTNLDGTIKNGYDVSIKLISHNP